MQRRQDQLAKTLSGGEQQMVAIGHGLMGHPKLLIFDEPSLGLAPLLAGAIFATLTTFGLIVQANPSSALT